MANKLKDMEISSVDLCKRGANQESFIKLFKSTEPTRGGENEKVQKDKFLDRLINLITKSVKEAAESEAITKSASMAEVFAATEALRKSLESIIADDTMSQVEKSEMMSESLQDFNVDITKGIESWSQALAEDNEEDADQEESEIRNKDDEDELEDEEEEETPDNVRKGVLDMPKIDIEKMSPEERAAYEELIKKYTVPEGELQVTEPHPDVQKALDEVAELRKSLEIAELTNIAKKYEIIGKKADELALKLYELKKAGEPHYNDYIALLEEMAKMEESGIFKEFGTSKSGGGSDLDGIVAEIMKSDSNLTKEQAVVKAFQTNPNLDPFTGKAN